MNERTNSMIYVTNAKNEPIRPNANAEQEHEQEQLNQKTSSSITGSIYGNNIFYFVAA